MEVGRDLRGGKDRISSLPDCLLHLIMSFLTAHRAVQTCVLSKRWKNLWTTLPFLNFDMWAFEDDIVFSNSESEDDEERFRRFTYFVNMTLVHREATNLHTFRLSCEDIPDHLHNTFKRSWIRYVIKHNPQAIDIKIEFEDKLPLDVLSCASLVNLSLCFGSNYTPCSDQYQNSTLVVNLPLLRRMHLQSIYLSQTLMEKIFCGCPMLEVLHLLRCNLDFSSIRSQSLKHLKLEDCCCLRGTNKMELIDAPNLLSFNYSRCIGYIGHKMHLNMPSLTSASICCEHCICGQYSGKSNIFTGIASIQSLELSGFWIKNIVENELPTCPEFQNVKDLSVDDFCLDCHFNLLASFLDHFPNLKKLSLSCSGLPCACQVKVDRNRGLLKIAPFRCNQLQIVAVRFSYRYKNFHWVLKYLQEAIKESYARIIITCG